MRRRSALPAAPLALGLYLLVALVFFGRHAVAHLGSAVIAPNDIDSSQYQWFLAWWPHAILHGLNPFITHAMLVPDGYNLTWTTSLAGPSLLLAPVTLLFGATVSFNVFSLLAPALSAWALCLLCRRLTSAWLPALLGGLVFELSGYMLTAAQGDPWLAFVALLPAAALLVIAHLDDSLSVRAFVGLLGGAVALQFLTSAEVLAIATLLGGFALLVAFTLFAERRRVLLAVSARIAVAYLLAGVVLLPYLIFMLRAHPVPNQALEFAHAPTDPTSLWVPGANQLRGTWQAAQWHRLGLPVAGNGFAYLGLPLVAIVVAYAIGRRRERTTQLLSVCFAAALVAMMGIRLVIAGHDTGLPLPWALFRHLPLLRYALPIRMGIYPALIASVILALWLAGRHGRLRWLAAGVAVAAMLPSLSAPVWHSTAVDPPFFQHEAYRRYLSATDNVLTIPAIGQNERWQAHTGFGFRIVGGYLGAFPSAYTRFAAWQALLDGKRSTRWPRALRAYLMAKQVTVILVDKRYGPTWPSLFSPLRIRPVDTGGVLLYRLRRAPA